MIQEIYQNFTVYACGKNEAEINDVRRMWEFDAFPAIFCHKITSGDVRSILEAIFARGTNDRMLIGFIGTEYFITDSIEISRLVEELGFPGKKYASIKEMYQLIK